MVLNKRNTRYRHKWVAAGKLEKVRLLKREDDLRSGSVRAYILFRVYWEQITKSGEPIHGEMMVDHRRTLHIPVEQLKRVGVHHINALDVFVDKQNRYWQAESGNTLTSKLFENYLDIECVRIDPPDNLVVL